MDIKIAVLVGDNGNIAACKYEGDKTDWSFLMDSAGVWDDEKHEFVYPQTEQRYVITATVPDIKTIPASLVERA